MRFCHTVLHTAASVMLLLPLTPAAAQSGLLYDPEPPADSAYVRVILASREGPVDVLVDGKLRQRQLAGGEAGEYLVLAAGKHTITLQAPGKTAAAPLEVISGRAMTLAFPALRADAKPWIFEDKANANKLKAVLAVYQLDPKAGPLDVLSADGATSVFSALAAGASGSLQVNPVSIDLIAAKAGDKAALAKVTLAMAPGGTYSILLLPGPSGKLSARATQNKVERYTGK